MCIKTVIAAWVSYLPDTKGLACGVFSIPIRPGRGNTVDQVYDYNTVCNEEQTTCQPHHSQAACRIYLHLGTRH